MLNASLYMCSKFQMSFIHTTKIEEQAWSYIIKKGNIFHFELVTMIKMVIANNVFLQMQNIKKNPTFNS